MSPTPRLARLSLSLFALAALAVACGDDAATGNGVDAGDAGLTTDGAPKDGASGDGAATADAATVDAGTPDAGTPALTFVPSNVPASALAGGAPGDLVFNGTNCSSTTPTINTDTGAIQSCSQLRLDTNYRYVKAAQGDGSMIGIILARNVRIETTLTVKVEGQLPLVVVAFDKAEILGFLDAGATSPKAVAGGFPGRDNSRGDGSGPGAGKGGTSGGAGGAAHCGLGGKGAATGAGVGGSKYGTAEIVPLLGGSSGGAGSIWGSGAGGGAVQIVAGTSLSITATGKINVGGAGGGQAGCGGGSGGALLLESPVVTVAGVIAANGGGGGTGSGAVHGEDGSAGDQPAKGGADSNGSAAGGLGSAGTTLDGTDGAPNTTVPTAGAGGGGGAGYIRINTTSGTAAVTGKVSPALTTTCATQGKVK